MSQKILSYPKASAVFSDLRKKGKTIVQCHGTFDLVHPGHVIHFEEAKKLGDVLVVTLTAAAHVNKGPGRPFFNDALRAKALAALEAVDYVVVVPHPAAVEAIELVRPHIYCKGLEYQDAANDVTGNIRQDVATVERLGGRVRYVGSVVFSSTRLLNNHFETQEPKVKDFCRHLAGRFDAGTFRACVDAFARKKVLVIGEVIFDRYSTVDVQGLTSKNRILSARHLAEETHGGGALAVVRHLREFTPQVRLATVTGEEPWLGKLLRPYRKVLSGHIRQKGGVTIVKQRFVEPKAEGKELSKLFSLNFIRNEPLDTKTEKRFLARLRKLVRWADIVLVMDFGHGLMTDPVRRLVEKQAKFLAVNCQTNSNNYGFNIINRRYRRADSFSLDQAEITLAVGRRRFDFEKELGNLRKQLRSRYAWLTRGGRETIGLTPRSACHCEPFERNIVDTVGAGDAFCAVATLAAAQGLPIEEATFLGQLAGAQAVRVPGNAEPVRKATLLKSGIGMLSY
ncbi:MAG: cytidyltransferase [Verrucomicrobia bacterium]|nr:cytidyltransferase [Verrucomicrobiota bacterium]